MFNRIDEALLCLDSTETAKLAAMVLNEAGDGISGEDFQVFWSLLSDKNKSELYARVIDIPNV
jgi:hypothetical protein